MWLMIKVQEEVVVEEGKEGLKEVEEISIQEIKEGDSSSQILKNQEVFRCLLEPKLNYET